MNTGPSASKPSYLVYAQAFKCICLCLDKVSYISRIITLRNLEPRDLLGTALVTI